MPSSYGFRHFLKPAWLICCLLIISSLTAVAQQSTPWKIITVSGRQYVTDQNLAQFYKMEKLGKNGLERIFYHPALVMKWKIHSKEMYVNDIKFNLSFPIAQQGDNALLSVVDLAKLIDPVIRPSYIKKPILFDTVVIDPGHGGHDSGARGRSGMDEADYNLDVSRRLQANLSKRGFKTVMTRNSDVFISLQQRVNIANAQKRAIFVSIHHNSGAKSARGVETFVLAPQGTSSTHSRSTVSQALNGNTRDAENIALATAIHAHVIHELRPTDRGVKRARFNVLTGINKPAILYEGGFLTNWAEGTKIHDPNYRQKTADAIALAIEKFRLAVNKR